MPQLSIEVVYHDEDLTEIFAVADNGRFAGCTTIYVNPNDLIEFGKQVKGFPQNISQVEKRELGYTFTKEEKDKFDELRKSRPSMPSYLTAYLCLNFYCIDSLGHPVVHLVFDEGNWSTRETAAGKASFEIMIEPAQIDKFADELIKIGSENNGKAILLGLHDGKEIFV
jgi:hypothetical protein